MKAMRSMPGRKKDSFEDYCFLEGGSTVRTDRTASDFSAFVPILTFLSGPALGKEIPLVHRQLVLGRGEDCDIVIPDPSVSRKHLQINCRKVLKAGSQELAVVIRDLDSKNGTFVNYEAVQQKALKPGDKISLGRVILEFDRRDLAEQNFYEEIFRLATIDHLTSLLNKATITRTLIDEIAASLRDQRWISIVLLDIDQFKSINDVHGHLMGDRLLQAIAKVLKTSIRRRDKVGRFGGDEFMIVLPETGPKGALRLAERIRSNVEKTAGAELEFSAGITVSLGAASCRAAEPNDNSLIEHADAALYRAKSLGRNRAELWERPRTQQFPRCAHEHVKKENWQFLSCGANWSRRNVRSFSWPQPSDTRKMRI
jgi:two-component system, cell cycle response regulator